MAPSSPIKPYNQSENLIRTKIRMNNFLFAINLPERYRDIASKSSQSLQECLEERILPSGRRCLRSDSEILRQIMEAKQENRFIGLPPYEPETSVSDLTQSSREDFSERSFVCSTPLRPEMESGTPNFVYVPETESEMSTSALTDTSFANNRSITTQTDMNSDNSPMNVTPESEECSPASPTPSDQIRELFLGPFRYVNTPVEAIADFHEDW